MNSTADDAEIPEDEVCFQERGQHAPDRTSTTAANQFRADLIRRHEFHFVSGVSN